MEYTEYMETLKEQIQNKRARSLVAEEIRGHIEEQAKEYQAEGMSKEDAEREAKESGALKETAEENANSIIEGLLDPILESQKYKLVWE